MRSDNHTSVDTVRVNKITSVSHHASSSVLMQEERGDAMSLPIA